LVEYTDVVDSLNLYLTQTWCSH